MTVAKGETQVTTTVPASGLDDRTTAMIQNDVDEEHDKWLKLGQIARLKYMVSNVTVEPLLGFFIVASVLGSLTTQNLNLQKSCRVNLNMSDFTCTALEQRNKDNYTLDEEARVQALVTDMAMWQSIIQVDQIDLFFYTGRRVGRSNEQATILDRRGGEEA